MVDVLRCVKINSNLEIKSTNESGFGGLWCGLSTQFSTLLLFNILQSRLSQHTLQLYGWALSQIPVSDLIATAYVVRSGSKVLNDSTHSRTSRVFHQTTAMALRAAWLSTKITLRFQIRNWATSCGRNSLKDRKNLRPKNPDVVNLQKVEFKTEFPTENHSTCTST